MRKNLIIYVVVLALLQLSLCRVNQALNPMFVRFIEGNLEPPGIWPGLTSCVVRHPGFAYLIPVALCGCLAVGIARRNDKILLHGIGLAAAGFCLYLLVRVTAIFLPFAGTLIGRVD